MPTAIEWIATLLFAIAVLHTFLVSVFARLAHRGGSHAGFWHLLAEVEVVFGVWAFVLIACMALLGGSATAIDYMDSRNFTEPLFVFVVMVVAGSRPIVEFVDAGVRLLARILPMRNELSMFLVVLSIVPLTGSFITEPAAMTLAAMLLRDIYFRVSGRTRFKYLTLGVLFVNVSIGGVLTSHAAPPVLMVASVFKWDAMHMATQFGWRAAIAVFINAGVLTFVCRKTLLESAKLKKGGNSERPNVPIPVILLHLVFLISVVLSAHHPALFLSLMMLFIGFAEAYKRHQSRLLIKEGLMVGFFLAGLVVLGGMQKWWLQDLMGSLSPVVLFWGAIVLTALTDNAALTYLGSLVEGTNALWRHMLVAGAVTGGGLTVIANAPNPAGFSILKSHFPDGSIAAGRLFLAALLPTLVAAGMFLLPI
jgi:hypothetical protein